MKFLFNSKGQHIANEVNGQLHAPTGENIGHFLQDYGIFIDMKGRYLGEVLYENRLLYNRNLHIDQPTSVSTGTMEMSVTTAIQATTVVSESLVGMMT